MLAGLPYVIWPIGSAFILASRKKEDPFLHYHAVQALLAGGILTAGIIVLLLGLSIFFRIMPGAASYFPAFLSLTFLLLGGGAVLAIVLTAIFLGWRATEGEMTRLPFIGDYAEEKMLDQTGMTRRQFKAMLAASMAPESADEEIPFPESLSPATPQSPRELQQRVPQQRIPQQRVPQQRAPQPSPPHDPMRSSLGARPQTPQKRPPRPTVPVPPVSRPTGSLPGSGPRPPQSTQPVVRDVDLIGHYKEKAPERSAKADVLKQWLSSVDNDS